MVTETTPTHTKTGRDKVTRGIGLASNYLRTEKQKRTKEGRPALLTAESVASGVKAIESLHSCLYCTCLKFSMIGEGKKKKKPLSFKVLLEIKRGKKILFTPNLLIHDNMFLMKSLHWKEPERASESRIPKSG